MTDYFALLNESRRPWLDPEVLKQKFLGLSPGVHPDRVHPLGESERAAAQERYVELNAAYRCLREPKDRLRHLLELELGSVPKDIQRLPSDLMDFLMTIGEVCREADRLVAEKAKITSPLLKVQCFERSQEWTGKLQALQRKTGAWRELLLEELKQIDRDWISPPSPGSSARAESLRRLEELHRLFSYFDRWLGQIQERIVRLSF